jgi:hypothetical protein
MNIKRVNVFFIFALFSFVLPVIGVENENSVELITQEEQKNQYDVSHKTKQHLKRIGIALGAVAAFAGVLYGSYRFMLPFLVTQKVNGTKEKDTTDFSTTKDTDQSLFVKESKIDEKQKNQGNLCNGMDPVENIKDLIQNAKPKIEKPTPCQKPEISTLSLKEKAREFYEYLQQKKEDISSYPLKETMQNIKNTLFCDDIVTMRVQFPSEEKMQKLFCEHNLDAQETLTLLKETAQNTYEYLQQKSKDASDSYNQIEKTNAKVFAETYGGIAKYVWNKIRNFDAQKTANSIKETAQNTYEYLQQKKDAISSYPLKETMQNIKNTLFCEDVRTTKIQLPSKEKVADATAKIKNMFFDFLKSSEEKQ